MPTLMIDPAQMAALNLDPAAITQSGQALRAAGGPIADDGAQVVRTWHGCDPFYLAPEAPVLVGALDPVTAETQQAGDRVVAVGSALVSYATTVEPLLRQAREMMAAAGSATPQEAAAKQTAFQQVLRELVAAAQACAKAIAAQAPNGGVNPIPARVKIGEQSSKDTGEITIGIIKINETTSIVETRFSDGKVLFTLTTGNSLKATGKLGGDAHGGPAGLESKVELAGGITLENGTSWLVDADKVDAFRALFQQYVERPRGHVIAPDGTGRSVALGDLQGPLPPLPPPTMVVHNFDLPVELKGKLDAAPPGPVDLTASATAGVTPKYSSVTLADGSTVSTFGGEVSASGEAKVYRDNTGIGGSGSTDQKGTAASMVSVTRDTNGQVTKVVLISSEDVSKSLGGGGNLNGPNPLVPGKDIKVDEPSSEKHTTVDVTTTTLSVDDANRGVVDQWLAANEGKSDVGLSSGSSFYPQTPDHGDPFQNLVHTDAQATKVRYENVTDKGDGFGASGSVGIGVGIDVSSETTTGHATSGTYLDRPDVNDYRSERPIPGVGD